MIHGFTEDQVGKDKYACTYNFSHWTKQVDQIFFEIKSVKKLDCSLIKSIIFYTALIDPPLKIEELKQL